MSLSNQHTTDSACDHQRVDQFLKSDHFRIEDYVLIAHLDSCTACREYLESHAADSETWNRAKTLLKTDEFDNAATAAFSAAGSQTQSGQLPLAIQDVLDALAPTDDPHRLGRIGTYEIAGVIGAGAMGVVLKAIDPALDRVIALKVMSPRLANNETARKRFAREAKAAAAVLHPNVIPIHSVSSDKALPYLVMAYIRGGSLQKRLEKEGPLQLVEILRIGSQIAAGLSAAHEQGLVHRDIKPENILLEEGVERVTITDFGLARAVDDNTVTQMGVIAGTPMYMSPEQARGEQVDQLSDLFSLGSVLYALCTGQPPYRSDSSYGVMRRIIDESPTPIRKLNPAIPEWLACIVERLMAKEKSARFATAGEVHKLLDACLSHVQQPSVIALPEIPGVAPTPESRSFFSSRKGILTMSSIVTAAVLMIAAFFMQQERPSITTYGPATGINATNPKKQVIQPSLTIESHKAEGSDGNGKTLSHHWKLKGQSVGTMTVRILHIVDGKSHVVSESVYQGGVPGEQVIELEMQLNNPGDPLPVAGKTLIPSLALSVNGLQSKAQTGERLFLPAETGRHGNTESGGIAAEEILMYAGYRAENVQFNNSIPSMLAASKNGAAFLVTTIEWKSADKATNLLTDDRKSIQGTWQVISIESEGRLVMEDSVPELQHVFTDNKLTRVVGKKKSDADYNLDPSASPKTIDIVTKDEKSLGIYELQGDNLRICIGSGSQSRPSIFNSQNGSTIVTFKRLDNKTADTKINDYSLKQITIKKMELNKERRLEITFEIMAETMWYCPGADGAISEQGLELTFPRVPYNKQADVEYPAAYQKASVDRTIKVDPKNKPVFIKYGEEREKIWDPNANTAPDNKLSSDDHSQLDDAKLLNGNWKAIYYEQAGKTASQKRVKIISMKFDEAEVTINTDGTAKVNSLTIDTKTKPISFDIKDQDNKITRGILDLQVDTLRLCFAQNNAARPTAFHTDTQNKDTVLLILKRVIPQPAYYFAADIETDFYRRENIATANFPDGELDVEQASEYTNERMSVELTSVTKFTRETARELAKTQGDLWLPDLDINNLSAGVIEELVKKNAGRLYLDKTSRLPGNGAGELAGAQCAVSMSGVDWISVEDAQLLAKISQPLKIGLKELDLDVAKELAKHDSWLILNKLQKLGEQQAAALAAHKRDLSLNALTTISPEVAEELGKFNGNSLELAGLAALDVETARKLSMAKCKETLNLDGLKAITHEVISVLANGNYSLSLQGIVVRDIETRRALDAATVKLRAAGKTLIWGEAAYEEDILLGGGGG